MNTAALQDFLVKFWDEEIVPTLTEYIKIPAKSPAFDPDWETAGHLDKVMDLALEWVEKHKPEGSIVYPEKVSGRTPLLMIDIPGDIDGSVLMYGHLDKQPEMEGWREDLGPWKPLMEGEKLYGRGGADDGYALFASIGIINALKAQGVKLPRIILVIEFCEESGSEDLPFYVDKFSDRIGEIDLVICLDSGAGNYEQFWNTASLRGMVSGSLRIDVLKQGVHSGNASGLVPSSFRVARMLLDRIEDVNTGKLKLDALHVDIPKEKYDEAESMINALGGKDEPFPYSGTMKPSTDDPVEGVLRRTWRPALSITGMDGVPPVKDGGNVLRPYTTLKFSLRIPPGLDAANAREVVRKAFTEDPPYDAVVTAKFDDVATGWLAPVLKPWLKDAINEASDVFYGKPAIAMGEGGSIPFMSMLGKKYPQAQFIVTGVLGPESNAHGPNEFIHIGYAKKLSACIAFVLSKYQKN